MSAEHANRLRPSGVHATSSTWAEKNRLPTKYARSADAAQTLTFPSYAPSENTDVRLSDGLPPLGGGTWYSLGENAGDATTPRCPQMRR